MMILHCRLFLGEKSPDIPDTIPSQHPESNVMTLLKVFAPIVYKIAFLDKAESMSRNECAGLKPMDRSKVDEGRLIPSDQIEE